MSFFIHKTFIFFILIIVIIPILFIPVFSSNNFEENIKDYNLLINTNSSYIWPVPGYTRISSYFGHRSSPTIMASSFHKGIDIPASVNSSVLAIADSFVKYTGFSGSGGYTIILESQNFQFIYHHMSPNFLVVPGAIVKSVTVIGYVGPKNVYGIKNNPYKDSKR